MKKDKQLVRAIQIAVDAHNGQIDKGGEPYIGHPLRVMNMGRTPDEKICGVLHDLVEDTDWTFEMLQREGFSDEIIVALKCLTKSDGEDYNVYLEHLMSNRLATSVKINDLIDNMDIRRLKDIKPHDVVRLNKYLRVYKMLTDLQYRNTSEL